MKNKFDPKKLVGPLAMGVIFAGLVSCAGDTGGGSGSNDRSREEQRADDQGTYKISFNRLNENVAPDTEARGFVHIDGNNVTVYMKVDKAPASLVHMQHIHSAKNCPDGSADINADGYVDVLEGLPSYGPILVNLDTDLNSFLGGAMTFPRADNDGDYVYKEKANYTTMMDDLHRADTDLSDAVVTLARGQGLNLPDRHIVIHGVAMNTTLPSTVGTIANLPAQMTLPIACGELQEINGAEEIAALAEMELVNDTSDEGSPAMIH